MHHLRQTRQWQLEISDWPHRKSSPMTTERLECYRSNVLVLEQFRKHVGIYCFVPLEKTSGTEKIEFHESR